MLRDAWTIAIETLSWMEMQRLSERLAFNKTIKQLGLNNINAVKLAYRLVCETTRRRNLIDRFVNCVMEPRTIGEYNLGIQSFLRIFVYQTRLVREWNITSFEEAKNFARMGRTILGWKTFRAIEPFLGFLLTQEPEEMFEGINDAEKIGLQTFNPTWFVEYCCKLFGREQALAFLKRNSYPPPTCIRLNTLKNSEKEIINRLSSEGIEVEKVELLKHAYTVLKMKHPLTSTDSFREGLFYIQDKASCLAAEIANPTPKETVFDICAAPGAKTTYLAQLMQNLGSIYSIDYSKRRMRIWKKEVARMKTEIAQPIIADALKPLPLAEEADILVLDPPCTSTGAFGKTPSAKWRLNASSIKNMAEIQWKMINNCAEKVKSGGEMIYSTCSITVEENELLIDRFLKLHSEFSLTNLEPKIGLPGLRGMKEAQRLYPHLHSSNGFFIAKLEKRD